MPSRACCWPRNTASSTPAPKRWPSRWPALRRCRWQACCRSSATRNTRRVAPQLAARPTPKRAARREQLAARARAEGVTLDLRVRHGEEPFAEIVDEARERAADLIVIRRRGKRSLLANLLRRRDGGQGGRARAVQRADHAARCAHVGARSHAGPWTRRHPTPARWRWRPALPPSAACRCRALRCRQRRRAGRGRACRRCRRRIGCGAGVPGARR